MYTIKQHQFSPWQSPSFSWNIPTSSFTIQSQKILHRTRNDSILASQASTPQIQREYIWLDYRVRAPIWGSGLAPHYIGVMFCINRNAALNWCVSVRCTHPVSMAKWNAAGLCGRELLHRSCSYRSHPACVKAMRHYGNIWPQWGTAGSGFEPHRDRLSLLPSII